MIEMQIEFVLIIEETKISVWEEAAVLKSGSRAKIYPTAETKGLAWLYNRNSRDRFP